MSFLNKYFGPIFLAALLLSVTGALDASAAVCGDGICDFEESCTADCTGANTPSAPTTTDLSTIGESTALDESRPIRAAHLTGLRTLVDQRRTQCSGNQLPNYTWTDSPITPGVTQIRAIHFQEILTAYNEIYSYTLPAQTYSQSNNTDRGLIYTPLTPINTGTNLIAAYTPIRATGINNLIVMIKNAPCCGDGACSGPETATNCCDCGGTCPTPVCDYNGVCEFGEDCANCYNDCNICEDPYSDSIKIGVCGGAPACPVSNCTPYQSCFQWNCACDGLQQECRNDLSNCRSCGDTLCENFGSGSGDPNDEANSGCCPADCGYCACNNDGICDDNGNGTENSTDCPNDCGCNGNGTCEPTRGPEESWDFGCSDCPCNIDGFCNAPTEDATNCPSDCYCGNGSAEGTEQCDGVSFNGETCVSRGYTGGTLSCSGGCLFDQSTCYTCGSDGCETSDGENNANCPGDCYCGNGTIEPGEQCDSPNMAGETCISRGYTGGTLSCGSCLFDQSTCYTCGCCGCEAAAGETNANCPGDCPTCDSDGVCDAGENGSNCSTDCCDASTSCASSRANDGVTFCRDLFHAGHFWYNQSVLNSNCDTEAEECATHSGCAGFDFVCKDGSTNTYTSPDICACGDSFCTASSGETNANCPGDCPPANCVATSVEVFDGASSCGFGTLPATLNGNVGTFNNCTMNGNCLWDLTGSGPTVSATCTNGSFGSITHNCQK